MNKIKNIIRSIREAGPKNVAAGAPIVLALSIAVFFMYIYLTSFSSLAAVETGLWGKLNQSNMIKYFLGLIVFALAFLLLRFVTYFIYHKASNTVFFGAMPRSAGFCIFIAYVLAFGAFLMNYLFRTELGKAIFGASPQNFAWRKIPIAFIVCYVASVMLWGLYQALKNKESSNNSTAYLFYFVAIFLSYVNFLFFNFKNWGDLHHAVAYTESIYNVYCGAPYNIITTGVYGHYGIFFGLVLKLIGGNAVTMAHLIALSGALSTAACAYIIHKITDKNYIRIPAILTCVISIVVLRSGNYWQLQPHRILFPLLTVAFVTYLAKNNAFTKVKMGLGYLLCMFAIVWNTESGMFCALAYTLALIVHFYQSDVWYSKKMWIRYAALIGSTVMSLLGAILFVNVYNLICGGELIFKTFFFPLGIDSYMNGVLKSDLLGGTQVWILVLFLFIVLLFLSLYNTKFFRRDREDYDPFAPVFIALAVVALLNFSYFANRAAYYNLDICCQFAGIALAIFADRFVGDWRNVLKKRFTFARISAMALSLVSFLVLIAMSTQIVFCVSNLTSRNKANIWNQEMFETKAQEFSVLVPEDYMVIGLGASTLNLQLERKAQYCYRDISDILIDGKLVFNTIVEDAVEYGKVAFYIDENDADTQKLRNKILGSGNFVLVSEGNIGEAVVQCYEKQ